MGEQWKLRLRVGQSLRECELPEGGKTLTRDCLQRVRHAAAFDQHPSHSSLSVRFGFPPTSLSSSESSESILSSTVHSLGMRNRDVLVVELFSNRSHDQPSTEEINKDPPQRSTSNRNASTSKKRKFPGVGKRLGGEVAATNAAEELDSDVMNYPRVNEISGGENDTASSLSGNMLNAVAGNPKAQGDKKALKAMHRAFTNALEERLSENEGVEKAAAASSGRYQVNAPGDGTVTVSYKGSDSKRKWSSETVDDLPAAVAAAVLKSIASSAASKDGDHGGTTASDESDDGFESGVALLDYIRKPERVAAASPRIVRTLCDVLCTMSRYYRFDHFLITSLFDTNRAVLGSCSPRPRWCKRPHIQRCTGRDSAWLAQRRSWSEEAQTSSALRPRRALLSVYDCFSNRRDNCTHLPLLHFVFSYFIHLHRA